MLLLYSIVIGLLLGKLLGGSISALASVRIHWMGLALIGLLGQVVLFSDQVTSRIGSAGPALYVASTLMVLAALLRNIRLPGLAVISVGAFLNLVAIALQRRLHALVTGCMGSAQRRRDAAHGGLHQLGADRARHAAPVPR